MIQYPKQEGKFFQHTESQQGDVRLKIMAAAVKLGKDIGGFAAKNENAEAEHFVYKIMRTDRREQIWTVKASSQIGTELARKNVQPGDVIKVHFLGMVMPTDYGMKAKYEVIKESGAQAEPEPVKQDASEEVDFDSIA